MSLTGTVCEQLCIGPIEAVSPTLAEMLRTCKLRAGISRAEGASKFVLGNPKAWLGIAYHEVLAATGRHSGDIDSVIAAVWKSAIDREFQRIKTHPLDRRFGVPESWPRYHLIAAMARIRAQELAAAKACSERDRQGIDGGSAEIYREQKFSGAKGRLVGRPDVVRTDEIIDFKSGDIHDDEDHERVRPSYVRQLRLYGFLVKESLGWWPRKGILIPMIGPIVEVEIEPEVCIAEANDAVRLLKNYNALVSEGSECAQFASPLPQTCRWCPFQTICPSFWEAVEPDWLGELGAAVVMGKLKEAPRTIHCGTALSLTIEIKSGTEHCLMALELAPVNSEIHPAAKYLQRGDEIRISGLSRRPDGTLRLTDRTILIPVSDLPKIVIQNTHSGQVFQE